MSRPLFEFILYVWATQNWKYEFCELSLVISEILDFEVTLGLQS